MQDEVQEVLSRLIRFNTVNPPGNEREAIQWLASYLSEAGLECEVVGAEAERPNLVATLSGEQDGPVLGYLGHVDTVLADAGDWQRDPWSGDVVDGFLWGRGALDMKGQVAAEAVAAATLARSGWRPPRGALKVFAVCDEEVGGKLGAKWLTEQRPDLARCDYLVNEGGGMLMPYGERRLYPICCGEKGTFRFKVVARGAAGHASMPTSGDNALTKLAPVIGRLAEAKVPYDMTEQASALLETLGHDPGDPRAAVAQVFEKDPRLAAVVEPTLGITLAPTRIFASEKINVIPARAELHVDCRAPTGMHGDAVMERVRQAVGDGYEIEFLEEVVGNASRVDTPLMDAIEEWIGEADAGGEGFPFVLPAFTDSRWWRAAFPQCVAYGFFPMREQGFFEAWPLIHGADERIDVRDLSFATKFFAELAPKLLA